MTSTSLMVHAIEIHVPRQASKLDAAAAWDVHFDSSVAASRRQNVCVASDLDHRCRAGGVLKLGRTRAREKAQRVALPDDPAAPVCEALHLKFRRIELASAMDHVRVLELDAVAGAPSEDERDRDDDGQKPGRSKT